MRVESYWNLHKHVFSIRALEGDHKGKVVEHVSHKTLHDVTFAVQPAGRAKVLREQKKNVHAFVRGTEGIGESRARYYPLSSDCWEKISYNPYKYDSFVDSHGAPVTHAKAVQLVKDTEPGYERAYIFAYMPTGK